MMDSSKGLKRENELITVECPGGEWKDLVYIEYPGIVKNEEKAIKTLGGLESINRACNQRGYNRLELRVRSDNIYCKPAVAKLSKTYCIAVKVRRINVPPPDEGSSKDDNREFKCYYSAELIGLVSTYFEFPGMFDFQVIPPGLSEVTHKGLPVEYNSMLMMTDLMDESCFNLDIPTFLPPTFFSRHDRPFSFLYKADNKHSTDSASTDLVKTSGSSRPKRMNYAYGIPFTHKGVPDTPHPDIPLSLFNDPNLEILKQMFEERPIWSRLALETKLNISRPGALRVLLPLVGYYFTSGPWRFLWTKFGYDPRLDASSKIYQVLDFRVPRVLESLVEPSQHYLDICIRPLGIGLETGSRKKERSPLDTESIYTFHPDKFPHQRQLYYMFCDIHEDSIQEMIHQNDNNETVCSEANGWCEESCYEKIRKKITELLIAKAQREGHNIQGSSKSS